MDSYRRLGRHNGPLVAATLPALGISLLGQVGAETSLSALLSCCHAMQRNWRQDLSLIRLVGISQQVSTFANLPDRSRLPCQRCSLKFAALLGPVEPRINSGPFSTSIKSRPDLQRGGSA